MSLVEAGLVIAAVAAVVAMLAHLDRCEIVELRTRFRGRELVREVVRRRGPYMDMDALVTECGLVDPAGPGPYADHVWAMVNDGDLCMCRARGADGYAYEVCLPGRAPRWSEV